LNRAGDEPALQPLKVRGVMNAEAATSTSATAAENGEIVVD
jgi:hypothetical protein